MKNLFFLILLLILFDYDIGHSQCGFDESMALEYKKSKSDSRGSGFPWIDALEDQLQETITNIENNNIVFDDVVIPVIVHVIHETGENPGTDPNIDAARVTKAVADLNADFANTGIQFCKAKRFPDGTPLTEHGIVRVNASSVPGYSTSGLTMNGQSEFDVKNLGPQFSNYNYLNIWTVKNIVGLNSNGEIRGFASFPLRTDATLDGVTMDVDFFGIQDTRVLTHEVGHYISLYHTFAGDDLDYDGVADTCPSGDPGEGDMVDDTDPHKRSPSGSCPSGPNECSNFDLQNIVHNHMNYSSETCRDYFSNDQITRMQASVLTFRPGVVDPLGCVEGCQISETVDFTVNPTNPISHDESGSGGEIAEFTGLSGSTASYLWYIDGEITTDNDGIESKLSHQFTETGKYVVCMRVTKDGCTIEECKDVIVFGAGICKAPVLDPCEKVVNGSFDESYPDDIRKVNANFSEFNPILKTVADMTIYDKICGWNNALNFLGICAWNNTVDYFYSIINYSSGAGGLRSSMELDLIPGVTYEGSIDLAISQTSPVITKIPEIYLALIEQDFIPTNPVTQTFDHATVESKKIHSIFYDEMITFVNQSTLAITDFNTYHFEFTYEAGMPKYLFVSLHGPDYGGSSANVFIDNISISECPPICEPDPEIVVTELDDCTFAFQGVNNGDPGIMYWDIETGPSDLVTNATTFSFAIPGIYEVCLNINCNENIEKQKCIQVDATACDNECGGAVNYIADVMKRCDEEGYRANVPISVDPGFVPCNDGGLSILPNGNNAEVTSSQYFFDNTGPTPRLELALFFENEPSGQYSVILCGPNGVSQCFTFGVVNDITECDKCETLPTEVTAECSDTDDTDNNYFYDGSFSITPNDGDVPCGNNVSTESGFNITSATLVGDQWDYEFDIATNSPGSFSAETTLCFEAMDGTKTCYTVVINVPEPCTVITDDCEYQTTSTAYRCSRSGDGVIFTFRHFTSNQVVTELLEGYELCEDGVSLSEEFLLLNSVNIKTNEGYISALEFAISCEKLEEIGSTVITLEFCNESGRTICLSIYIDLYCDECPKGKSNGRIGEELTHDYDIYPNPTNDIITIVTKPSENVHEYKLLDLNGSLISTGELSIGENKLSLLELNSGVYLIQVMNGKSIYNQKIIKL